MKRILAFLKTTMLGGLIVVLPAWLALLLVIKALWHLQIFVKPISSHLPHGVAHPRVIAILLLVGLCFLVGAAIQTAIGAKAERAAERAVLEKIPGYTTLRSLASRLSDHSETASFQPALVEIEEALVPGFIVEQHSGNRCTVFIPSVPTPMAGAVYIIDNSRVHPLDLPAVAVMQCISKWGGGSSKLLAAYDQRHLGDVAEKS
jgi:uncharacterized membrane protein